MFILLIKLLHPPTLSRATKRPGRRVGDYCGHCKKLLLLLDNRKGKANQYPNQCNVVQLGGAMADAVGVHRIQPVQADLPHQHREPDVKPPNIQGC